MADIEEEVTEREFLSQVIELTREVNLNLRTTIVHTDRLIARQNILIGICPIIITLLVTLLFFVYNCRKSQELISAEMQMVHYHLSDVANERKAASQDLVQVRDSLDTLKVMLESAMCVENP